jgi:catechol 2,3-dioxygenase-like lactoylglutathione lyase family enzyme
VGVQLAKSGIDLGIVVENGERALAFYCGLLGLEHVGDIPMPIGGGGTMHRVQCGDSLLKLVCFNETPPSAVGGGIPGALGFRYLTLTISNLDEILAECADADVPVIIPATDLRPGVRIGIVSDPDGNWIEFLEASSPRPTGDPAL